MNDTQNFMVCKTPRYHYHLVAQSSKMTAISLRTGGGCKNFLGNSKHCERNVIVHPGAGMSKSGAPCQTDDNLGKILDLQSTDAVSSCHCGCSSS